LLLDMIFGLSQDEGRKIRSQPHETSHSLASYGFECARISLIAFLKREHSAQFTNYYIASDRARRSPEASSEAVPLSPSPLLHGGL
jgi:hypothetical protein